MIRILSKELFNGQYINSLGNAFNGMATISAIPSKKKKASKMGAVMEKKILPVETDANRLVNYVCGSNILNEGGEDIKLKADSEYPDWLWKLNTGKPKPLEQMDPNSKEYWIKVRKMAIVQHHKLKKLRKW